MSTQWITAFAAAQHQGFPQRSPSTAGKTLKAVIPSGLSGTAFRLVFAERYSPAPVQYGAISVAVRGRKYPVLFGGNPQITIRPGETVYSDPIACPLQNGDSLSLWIYNRGKVRSSSACMVPALISPPGNFCGLAFEPAVSKIPLPPGMPPGENLAGFVGIQILPIPGETPFAIAAFGDSITKMDFWVAPLREKIRRVTKEAALLNCGIGGNRLLRDTHFSAAPKLRVFGDAGLARIRWDLLDHPGVRTVILALGINDISQPKANPMSPPLKERCRLPELVSGYERFLQTARTAGLRVLGATITPFGGYVSHSPETEALRQGANDWIKTAGAFDGVIDFAAAVCDPQNPDALDPRYDSGDHLHPGPAGGQAMADLVQVPLLLQ